MEQKITILEMITLRCFVACDKYKHHIGSLVKVLPPLFCPFSPKKVLSSFFHREKKTLRHPFSYQKNYIYIYETYISYFFTRSCVIANRISHLPATVRKILLLSCVRRSFLVCDAPIGTKFIPTIPNGCRQNKQKNT